MNACTASPTKRFSFIGHLLLEQVSWTLITLIMFTVASFPDAQVTTPSCSPKLAPVTGRIINQNQRMLPRWHHETGHSCQRRLAKTKYKDNDTSKLAHDTKKAQQPYATTVYLEEEYLVTALVPSEIACLESSPLNIQLAYVAKENKQQRTEG